MLIIPLLVAGSIAYAGAKVLAANAGSWRIPLPHTTSRTAAVAVSAPAAGEYTARTAAGSETAVRAVIKPQVARRHHAAATAALGLAAGGTVFPALMLASVPLTIYSNVPILEAGWYALGVERKVQPPVVASLLIAGAVLAQHNLAAASLSWLYHVSWRIKQNTERFASEVLAEINNRVLQVTGNAAQTVWKVYGAVEVQIPLTELAPGDVIVVSQGNVIPLDGIVTSGAATLNLLFRTGVTTPVAVGEGDPVYARSVVTDGQIRVRIEQNPC